MIRFNGAGPRWFGGRERTLAAAPTVGAVIVLAVYHWIARRSSADRYGGPRRSLYFSGHETLALNISWSPVVRGGFMEECRFSCPVTVRSGKPAVIADLGAAFAALHRGSLGGHRLDIPEWQIAFDKVVRAKLDPAPEKVEDARAALQALANLEA